MLSIHASPLFEKQTILFAIRKRMIGRRAYTDSACSYKKEKPLSKGLDAGSEASSSSSSSSSRDSSPRYNQEELDRKIFECHAC